MALISLIGNFRRLFGYADYRRYTVGNAISLIGTWMQRVAVGWLTWKLTGSGAWLGLIAFADLFPVIIIGPIAGAIADRRDLLKLLRVTQALGFLQAVLLAGLHAMGLLTMPVLLAGTLALGIIAAFAQPARLAIISAMVPRADLGAAVAMNAVVFNLARFLGPALAGVLIATVDVTGAFAANAVSYLAFVLALMRMTAISRAAAPRHGGLASDVAEGLAHVMRRPGLRTIMLVTIAMGLGARPVVELLPGFASGVFGGDATALAALTSAVGVGAIVGGGWMLGRGSAPGLARTFLLCATGSACAVLLFAMTGSLLAAVPVAAIMGFAMVCTGISAQTLLQLAADDGVKGRILSIYGLLQRGCPAIGALAMGVLSEWTGLRLAAAAGGAFLLAFALALLANAGRTARQMEAPDRAAGE